MESSHFSSMLSSARQFKQCSSCGGYGRGLVQSNGMCSHCKRLLESTSTSTETNKRNRVEDETEFPPGKRFKEDIALEDTDMTEEDIARLLEDCDKIEVPELDEMSLKNILLSLEKKINKNQRLRIKYADVAPKFMDSEIDLDEQLKEMVIIAASPELFPVIVKMNAVSSILGLLSHENTDIAISVISLINTLTDPEVIGETEATKSFIEALLSDGLFPLLVQNLTRLKDENEDDAMAIHASLNIIENMSEIQPSTCVKICKDTNILLFLLQRILKKPYHENKLYSSEILSILVQTHLENQNSVGDLPGDVDGIDMLLQACAVYRKRNPNSEEEEECIENIFNALCSCLTMSENKTRFRHSEGFELMIRIMKEKKFARHCAIKTLEYALDNNVYNCEKFVEVSGLKTLFPAFMGKKLLTKGIKHQLSVQDIEGHVMGIVEILLFNLPENSVHVNRILDKFLGSDGEKIDRLVDLHMEYSDKILNVRLPVIDNDEDDYLSSEDRIHLLKMDAGLETLQRVDIIMTSLSAVSPQIKLRLLQKLEEQDVSLESVTKVIKEYIAMVGGEAEGILEKGQESNRKLRLNQFIADFLNHA